MYFLYPQQQDILLKFFRLWGAHFSSICGGKYIRETNDNSSILKLVV